MNVIEVYVYVYVYEEFILAIRTQYFTHENIHEMGCAVSNSEQKIMVGKLAVLGFTFIICATSFQVAIRYNCTIGKRL